MNINIEERAAKIVSECMPENDNIISKFWLLKTIISEFRELLFAAQLQWNSDNSSLLEEAFEEGVKSASKIKKRVKAKR